MTSVRAVTLDAAGTLITPAEPVGTTYARVASRHGIAVDATTLERGFRAAFGHAPPLAFADPTADALAAHERTWWREVVREAFGPLGDHPAFESAFAGLFAHYARPEAWRVFPEVRATLDRLRTRGLGLAVVSNFDGRLPALLQSLGLIPPLAAVVYSSAFGAAKPAAAIFHQAAAVLGVPPAAVLHAGDDPVADVDGALGAGMRAALVDRAGDRPALPRGAVRVTTLAELEAHLD